MAGFISGDGCFHISINKNRNKIGIGFSLIFQISQHISAGGCRQADELLLKSFIYYFKCGYYVRHSSVDYCHFQARSE